MNGNSIDMTCISPPDPAQKTFSLQMCGNGIVEAGEDCDPGVGVNSTCCDTTTCKLRPGALCDPLSGPCCTGTCQFAPSTQVCRPSKDSACDIAESCSGTSATCPADKTQSNGQSCGANGLACANGLCTSITQQCRTVGASLGLQQACPQAQQTCQISCEDPKNPTQCIVLNSQLVVGSPCGFGGTCDLNGNCQAGTLLDTVIVRSYLIFPRPWLRYLILNYLYSFNYQAWYKQNLQVAIPVSIVVGIVALLIIFGLLKCVKRCCCGRSKPQIIPKTPIVTSIPSNVPGQRIPSWSSLQNNRNEVGGVGGVDRDGRRDSAQPLMYNSVPPQRRALSPSPAFNRNGNGRPSEDAGSSLPYSNPFEPTEQGRGAQHPAALRPGGPSLPPRPQLPPRLPPGARAGPGVGISEPSYPLPPAAPRQSTWSNSPGVAGIGSGAQLQGEPRSKKWVDDQLYNGPRS